MGSPLCVSREKPSKLDPMTKPKGLYILRLSALQEVYSDKVQADIAELLDLVVEPQTPDSVKANPEVLQDVEVIMSSWGAPVLDEAFLAYAPNLKIIFYGAGSIRYFVTDASWQRGIRVSSAYRLNAVAVTEYALATILLSLKRFWHYAQVVKKERYFSKERILPGNYGSTVGLVSLGSVGRGVLERLKHHEHQVIAYDPFLTEEEAQRLGVENVSLEELFKRADVVSLHTPALEETHKMVKKEHFASMKEGATFINSARGMVIDEAALIDVLQERTDLYAILDVTDPEPPVKESLLYDLPNVLLTPHIAGNVGKERERQGQAMLEELQRYLAGESLQHEITQAQAKIMA